MYCWEYAIVLMSSRELIIKINLKGMGLKNEKRDSKMSKKRVAHESQDRQHGCL